jgi:hypothetical protein
MSSSSLASVAFAFRCCSSCSKMDWTTFKFGKNKQWNGTWGSVNENNLLCPATIFRIPLSRLVHGHFRLAVNRGGCLPGVVLNVLRVMLLYKFRCRTFEIAAASILFMSSSGSSI